jgi:hypothetical protein
MTLQDLLSLPIAGKQIAILGMPAAGKTWLAKQFDPHELCTIHTDDYIGYDEVAAIHSIEEDAYMRLGKPYCIVEGCFGYQLLLAGAQRKTYMPDIVLDLSISRAAQRVIYLRERDPDKLKHLKRFHEMNTKLFQEWAKIATHDTNIISFTNEYEPCY